MRVGLEGKAGAIAGEGKEAVEPPLDHNVRSSVRRLANWDVMNEHVFVQVASIVLLSSLFRAMFAS
jgi:hypothetical protein